MATKESAKIGTKVFTCDWSVTDSAFVTALGAVRTAKASYFRQQQTSSLEEHRSDTKRH